MFKQKNMVVAIEATVVAAEGVCVCKGDTHPGFMKLSPPPAVNLTGAKGLPRPTHNGAGSGGKSGAWNCKMLFGMVYVNK